MKPETRLKARNRFAKRKAGLLVFYDTTGKRFVADLTARGEIILPAQTADPLPNRPVVSPVPDAHGQTPFPVYSSIDIQQVGGLDALSVAIGNTKPIHVPSIEFTEAEWNSMLGEQSVQE